jgi:hypothetical protein
VRWRAGSSAYQCGEDVMASFDLRPMTKIGHPRTVIVVSTIFMQTTPTSDSCPALRQGPDKQKGTIDSFTPNLGRMTRLCLRLRQALVLPEKAICNWVAAVRQFHRQMRKGL